MIDETYHYNKCCGVLVFGAMAARGRGRRLFAEWGRIYSLIDSGLFAGDNLCEGPEALFVADEFEGVLNV